MNRRDTIAYASAWLSGSMLGAAPFTASASSVQPIRLNLPGPNSLAFLPLELIPKLGLDKSNGVTLQLRYFPSGVLALQDMLAGNAHFSASGFAVLPATRTMGKRGVAIAALSGSDTPIQLIVREDLAAKIPAIRDLKGRSIGVSTGSTSQKTYLQLKGEAALKAGGVSADSVRWVPMAQNWSSVKGVLDSKSADAVFAEEPFAARLVYEKMGRTLTTTVGAPGREKRADFGHFRAVVSVSAENLQALNQERRILLKLVGATLDFLGRSKPEEIIAVMAITDRAEKEVLVATLAHYKNLFAKTPAFPEAQRQATAASLQELGIIQSNNPAELAQFIDDAWGDRRQ